MELFFTEVGEVVGKVFLCIGFVYFNVLYLELY